MAEKKITRSCFGPPGLIKKLKEECSWIEWLSGKSFNGFEFNGCRLYQNKKVFMESRCRIIIKDIESSSEFSIEGFCDSTLLVDFFDSRWKPMRLATHFVNQDPMGGRDPHYFEVFMEILEENPEETS